MLETLRQDHENLVQIYGIVKDEPKKKTRIIMEKCDSTLEDLIEVRRLSLPEVIFIMIKILTGLEFLHAKNIMHR